MTTSVFPALTNAEQIFYDLVWTPMLQLGENWLEVELPFLKLPVFQQLEEGALKTATDDIFNALVQLLDITAIQWKNAANKSAYDQASLQLAIVAQQQGITSDAYKKARDAALEAQSQFTRLPGT